MGLFDFLFGKKSFDIKAQASLPRSPASMPSQRPDDFETSVYIQESLTPPSEWQIQEAAKLGIVINKGISSGELQAKIKDAKAKLPPYKSQIELCNRIGLVLLPSMTRADVDDLIVKAKKDPKYVPKFAELDREKQLENQRAALEVEEEDRRIYGDELVDLFRKWEAITDSGVQHILVFRKGKSIVVDVVEFDSIEIDDTKKPFVKLNILRPRIRKERDSGQYLEWDKEVAVNAQKVLHVQRLATEVDMFDVSEYLRIIEISTDYAKRFEV